MKNPGYILTITVSPITSFFLHKIFHIKSSSFARFRIQTIDQIDRGKYFFYNNNSIKVTHCKHCSNPWPRFLLQQQFFKSHSLQLNIGRTLYIGKYCIQVLYVLYCVGNLIYIDGKTLLVWICQIFDFVFCLFCVYTVKPKLENQISFAVDIRYDLRHNVPTKLV